MNQAILEGIRRAIIRGETLRDAMMSFFNAGYPKPEIEEAARAWQMEQLQMRMASQGQIQGNLSPTQIKYPPITQQPSQIPTQTTSQQTSTTIQGQIPTQQTPLQQTQGTIIKTEQKVSEYGAKPKRTLGNKILIGVLIIILLLFIGGLVASFIFKQEIIDFFAKSFGS